MIVAYYDSRLAPGMSARFGDVVRRLHHGRCSVQRPRRRKIRCNRFAFAGREGAGDRGGVVGKDQREGDSPSWFNPHECTVVLDLVKALLRVRGKRIAPSDVGVITPYNKQAQKIVRLLTAANVPCKAGGVKVGSTELFQGQERKVIILSTVRSSMDHIGFDVLHHLGFLQNPKRFNVATTRACSLMIVVGNPHVLATDPHWACLLRECIRLGGYRGEPLPEGLLNPRPPPGAASGGGGGGEGEDTYDDNNHNDHNISGGEGEEARRMEGQLADALEALMLGASERVQQEGLEMPTWGA
eukprot:1175651-Prorocentrum_minimum.AAC.2